MGLSDLSLVDLFGILSAVQGRKLIKHREAELHSNVATQVSTALDRAIVFGERKHNTPGEDPAGKEPIWTT
jgi:hypothetical protein